MTAKTRPSEDAHAIRRAAEGKAAELERASGESLASRSPAEIATLLHELRVHQIELELQNDELRRTRDELEASRARYFELYDLAPVGYCTVSATGLVLEANLTAATLLCVPRSKLVREPLTRFILREDQDPHYLARKRLLETGEPQRLELRLVKGDGSSFWAQLDLASASAAASPARSGAAGTERAAVRVVLTDISLRRQAEEERRALELALSHAQKLEAVGTLAGGIAHDFNNILAGILGGLSVLDADLGEGSPYHADINDMEALGRRGASLTRQLLGFGRGGQYDARPLDLSQVVRKTCGLFGRTRTDLSIQLDFADGLPAVLMDQAQLEQVLLNLLVNAGHAMPGGGRILLRGASAPAGTRDLASPGTEARRFVQLTLADEGVGMTAETKARIFEPFFTTRPQGQGTGLGLPSVHGIVQHHGGFLRVESELGKGTTFELFLPATDWEPAAESAPVAAAQGSGLVLVVDDEPMVVRMVARMLEKLGYTVLTATGGQRAVELARQHGSELRLVVLDLTMPGMSGAQTFDELRALVPGLKVLLCSGFSEDGQARKLLDRGCCGFLQKPFDAATLAAKVKEAG